MVETAKSELGINAKKVNNSWYWDLRNDEAQDIQEERNIAMY